MLTVGMYDVENQVQLETPESLEVGSPIQDLDWHGQHLYVMY